MGTSKNTIKRNIRRLVDSYGLQSYPIEFVDIKSFWGQYSRRYQVISISDVCLEQGSTKQIIDVVLHEIAHAITDSIAHNSRIRKWQNIKAHGKEFRFICKKIPIAFFCIQLNR